MKQELQAQCYRQMPGTSHHGRSDALKDNWAFRSQTRGESCGRNCLSASSPLGDLQRLSSPLPTESPPPPDTLSAPTVPIQPPPPFPIQTLPGLQAQAPSSRQPSLLASSLRPFQPGLTGQHCPFILIK
jgi:hypothetical protein